MTTARRWRTACCSGPARSRVRGDGWRQPDIHRRRRLVRPHTIDRRGSFDRPVGQPARAEANRGVDGRYYSQYGIGQSIYNVPSTLRARSPAPDSSTDRKTRYVSQSCRGARQCGGGGWSGSPRVAAVVASRRDIARGHRRGLERGDRVAALAVFEIRVLDAAHRGRSAGQRVSPARRG